MADGDGEYFASTVRSRRAKVRKQEPSGEPPGIGTFGFLLLSVLFPPPPPWGAAPVSPSPNHARSLARSEKQQGTKNPETRPHHPAGPRPLVTPAAAFGGGAPPPSTAPGGGGGGGAHSRLTVREKPTTRDSPGTFREELHRERVCACAAGRRFPTRRWTLFVRN